MEDILNNTGMTSKEFSHFAMSTLMDDLTDCITKTRKNHEEYLRKYNTFYISIVEKRESFSNNTMKRKIFVFWKRPYPEAGTDVFKHEYKYNHTFFCWTIPHRKIHHHILAYPHLYSDYTVQIVKAWRNFYYDFFGFHQNRGLAIFETKKNNDICLEDYKEVA